MSFQYKSLGFAAIRQKAVVALSILVLVLEHAMIRAAEVDRGLHIDRVGTNALVRFSGVLMSASRPEGPYELHGGIASPYAVSNLDSQRFWRALLPGVSTAVAGDCHSVAIRADGTLWTWGCNFSWQLGTATPDGATAPTNILPGLTWQTVAAGRFHSLAISTDGTLWEWGEYSATGRSLPRPILTNWHWQTVAAGFDHTVAVREDGTLWAWGQNESGQLGDGTFSTSQTPRAVSGGGTWLAVAAGYRYTVAVRSDLTLWAWGDNYFGQLGDTTMPAKNTPHPIQTNTTWRAVSAGDGHIVAIRANGSLWTWGRGDHGQLGNGTVTHTNVPQALLPGSSWQAVAAGGKQSFALRSDGMLWAWGYDFAGSLGIGSFPAYPTELSTPQPILTNVTWRSVSAGEHYALAVRSDGELWSWGSNVSGQLGNGSARPWNAPRMVASEISWRAVTLGLHHTVALGHDGSLWGWGNNSYGQLGNSQFNPLGTNRPQPIATNSSWQSVAAGHDHTLALRADGTLWSWGGNYEGQLGLGFVTRDYPRGIGTPRAAAPTRTWTAIAAGRAHSVGLSSDGSLWTWGDNSFGQLGIGTTFGSEASPQLIASDIRWKSIAAGSDHTVAVRADGTLWVWGRNDVGQLGLGTLGPLAGASSPQPISSSVSWKAVSAGGGHTVALRENGSLWVWGDNSLGQLGSGAQGPIATGPFPILTTMTWQTIAAGSSNTFAIRSDGQLWSWGWNTSGQLGDGDFLTGRYRGYPARVPIGASWLAVAAGHTHAAAIRAGDTLWAWGSGELGEIARPFPWQPNPVLGGASWFPQ